MKSDDDTTYCLAAISPEDHKARAITMRWMSDVPS